MSTAAYGELQCSCRSSLHVVAHMPDALASCAVQWHVSHCSLRLIQQLTTPATDPYYTVARNMIGFISFMPRFITSCLALELQSSSLLQQEHPAVPVLPSNAATPCAAVWHVAHCNLPRKPNHKELRSALSSQQRCTDGHTHTHLSTVRAMAAANASAS